MADVRKTARTTIAIVLTIFVLNRLWVYIFRHEPVGVSLALILWGLFVLCVGAGVYLAVVLAFKLLRAVFGINFERSATEEAVLFWGVILISGLTVYYMFPESMTRIQDFVFIRGGAAAARNFGDVTGPWLTPSQLPGAPMRRYSRIAYAALVLMVAARLIMAVLEGSEEPGSIRKQVYTPVAMMGIMLAMALYDNIHFSLHRVWAVFLALMLIGLGTTAYKVFRLRAGLEAATPDSGGTAGEAGAKLSATHVDLIVARILFWVVFAALWFLAFMLVAFIIEFRAFLSDVNRVYMYWVWP